MDSLSSFTKSLSKTQTNYNIIEFTEKKSCLGIKLFPSQRYLLKLFEKIPLNDEEETIEVRDRFGENVLYKFTELGFHDFLYNEGRISLPYDVYMNTPLTSFLLACGRGATKTTTISIYTAYKLYEILSHYCPQEYFNILAHDAIDLSVIALGESNALEIFSRITTLINNAPFFKPYLLEDPLQGELRIWTQADLDKIKGYLTNPPAHSNSIKLSAKPCSPGLRGANRALVIMEELAFFNNSANSSRNLPLDEQIYRAVTPSVARFKYPDGTPFGKVLMISSPSGESGKFYEEYKSAFTHGAKSAMIALSTPTWYLNPSLSKTFYMSEFTKNPQAYNSEYGAEFQSYENRWLVDDSFIYKAFDTSLEPQKPFGEPNISYYMGIDAGFSEDGFSIAVSHFEPDYVEVPENLMKEAHAYFPDFIKEIESNGGKWVSQKYVLDYYQVFYPGKPPYENYAVLPVDGDNGMVERVVTCAKKFPIRKGIFDQFSGVVLDEMFKKRGLKFLEMVSVNAAVNNDIHKIFNMLLHQSMLKMGYDADFLKELKALKASVIGNGFLRVEHPNGGHDDLYSAVARSFYLAWLYTTKNKSLLSNMGLTYKENQGGHLKNNYRATDLMRNKLFQNSLRNPKNMFPNRMK